MLSQTIKVKTKHLNISGQSDIYKTSGGDFINDKCNRQKVITTYLNKIMMTLKYHIYMDKGVISENMPHNDSDQTFCH